MELAKAQAQLAKLNITATKASQAITQDKINTLSDTIETLEQNTMHPQQSQQIHGAVKRPSVH